MTPPGSLADPSLLTKVDRLFATGIGEYVSLPQIVVCGDQSSGKSSVLEGLTKLPFPRDSGLCTRFATQIVFQRAAVVNFSVSIIPDNSASEEYKATVRAWGRPNLKGLDPLSFAEILSEVQDVMGLGGQSAVGKHGTFSKDILKIEIHGPSQEHYSVVDVPGIFRLKKEGVTTDADKEMVLAMVRKYIDNPRSIILAVVPANVDIATQDVLDMAEKADKEGNRTIGILTKPDLVDKGAEPAVIDIVRGKSHKLKLGWCVVRNLGQQQLLDKRFDRDELEMEFFRKCYPWSTVEEDRVGVRSLQVRLQDVLASSIRQEFPKVKKEILKRLATARQALEDLGVNRTSSLDQTRYLQDISMQFQSIVACALSANYNGSDWFDEHPSLKFATSVVDRNEELGKTLHSYGHTYHFENDLLKESGSNSDSKQASEEPPPIPDLSDGSDDDAIKCDDENILVRSYPDLESLDDILSSSKNFLAEPRDGIRHWLKKVHKSSRGFELGTFETRLLSMAMKSQTSKWSIIAEAYMNDMIVMVHTFVLKLLELVCPDSRVREGLTSVLTDKLFKRYRASQDQMRFLLQVERKGTPATLNHYFNDNLEKSRGKRLQDSLNDKIVHNDKKVKYVRVEDLMTIHPMSNAEHMVQDIHDILRSYYKVALKRFSDNLIVQASDHFLVTGSDSPLRVFSPKFVSDLSEAQLEEIAGEDTSSKRKRALLEKEVKNLEAAKKVLTSG